MKSTSFKLIPPLYSNTTHTKSVMLTYVRNDDENYNKFRLIISPL